MTLIQPNKHNNLLNAAILMLSITVTGAVICLIFLYNQTVSFGQEASSMREEIALMRAENSELKIATFELLDPTDLSGLAAAYGLEPAAPRYVTIPTWVAASHF